VSFTNCGSCGWSTARGRSSSIAVRRGKKVTVLCVRQGEGASRPRRRRPGRGGVAGAAGRRPLLGLQARIRGAGRGGEGAARVSGVSVRHARRRARSGERRNGGRHGTVPGHGRQTTIRRNQLTAGTRSRAGPNRADGIGISLVAEEIGAAAWSHSPGHRRVATCSRRGP